jgi:hypothetical protein
VGLFLQNGKQQMWFPYLKMGRKIVHQITGPSPCYLTYPKFLKELSTMSYMVTAQKTIFSHQKIPVLRKGMVL